MIRRILCMIVIIMALIVSGTVNANGEGIRHRVEALEEIVAALQEESLSQQDEITALQEENASQQDEIDALEARVAALETALADETAARMAADDALQAAIDGCHYKPGVMDY